MFCHNCGAALADQSRFCESCGTHTRTRGTVPREEGSPRSAIKQVGKIPTGLRIRSRRTRVTLEVVVIGALLGGLLLLWGLSNHASSGTSTTVESPPVQTAPQRDFAIPLPSSAQTTPQGDSSIPPLQESFTTMIDSFIPRYNGADTEIRKTSMRFERKDAIIKYFSGSEGLRFEGWVGEVKDLRTESDGNASVSIKLWGTETVIKTWNNSFSDSSSHTMISRSDVIYRSLMDIKEGDEVTVSGTFIPADSGQDYAREASLTEGGSMTSPEFIVKFSQISKK